MKKTIVFTMIIVMATLSSAQDFTRLYDFMDEEQNETIILQSNGRFAPKIENGYLELMNGGRAKRHNNTATFPDIIDNKSEIEKYHFELYITRGAEGAGLALINTAHPTEIEDWTNPNIKGGFALGIDVYNPQSSHWFDEWGNFYGREEREISLHWDGKERFKMMSPVEFRVDPLGGDPKKFELVIQYVTAGALINVIIEDTKIIDNYFIPEMIQYNKQPVFGATTAELTTSVYLANFGFTTSGKAPVFSKIAGIVLIKDEVFTAGRRNMETTVTFPRNTSRANKVILTIDLGGPAGGVSAWDVTAGISLTDRNGNRVEICRYITPYNRPYVWKVDVSDFLPLFTGSKGIFAWVDTWEEVKEDPLEQKGWKVTAMLDFYTGKQEYTAFSVINLWNGSFEYGNPERPMSTDLPDKEIIIPRGAKSAKLRIVVSGHGMVPNSENAAEFKPSERTVTINGEEYHNLLWRTDCYLNPCRPQDGTWKFDRAGWAPGDIVWAWEINLDKYLNSRSLKISYTPDDYVNHNRGETWEPFHRFGSQVIFYR